MLETSKTAKIVQFAGECSVFTNFPRKPVFPTILAGKKSTIFGKAPKFRFRDAKWAPPTSAAGTGK